MPFFLVRTTYRNSATRINRKIYFCILEDDPFLDIGWVGEVSIKNSNLIIRCGEPNTVLRFFPEKKFCNYLINIYENLNPISRIYYYKLNKDKLNNDNYI